MLTHETPFLRFWRSVNDERASRQLPELKCGEAHRRFETAVMGCGDTIVVEVLGETRGRIWA